MDEVEVVVGRRRGPRWRQVAHGLHRSIGARGDRVEDQARAERLADLRAWQRLLPPSACFTHLTAAEVYGLWLPPVPPGLPVLACVPKGEDRPRRDGIRVSRLTGSVTPVTVAGVRVAPLPEVLLACSRDLGLLDLVVLLDSALRRGSWAQQDFEQVARPRRRGAPALREALEYADVRAESPWESLLRLFHVLCGVPVEPQREVRDERGAFVARGDLWLRGTTTLHEYDGAVHRDRRTHLKDLARERGLANAGWTRRGYTAGDLLGRALVMLREADGAIGRAHDPRRLDPWRAALRESLFTEGGRQRLEARLSRH
jgi:hypothetical protein